jgi:hypothetical protein
MPLTTERVKEFISQGESQRVEFKSRLPSEDIIAKSLAAFANSEGGVFIIGVNDDATIVGVPENEINRTLEVLRNVSKSLLRWSIPVATATIDNHKVVYAYVGVAPKEYAPVVTSRGEVFVRQGDHIALVRGVPAPAKSSGSVQVVIFVAMSFRNEEEPSLVDYWAAMERAVKETGLPIKLCRIDLQEGDYEISQQIMDEIDAADIVLADFTLSPRNVYFELGYARAMRRYVIQTARKDTVLEFDNRNWRTLFYRNATELEAGLIPAINNAYTEVVDKRLK